MKPGLQRTKQKRMQVMSKKIQRGWDKVCPEPPREFPTSPKWNYAFL